MPNLSQASPTDIESPSFLRPSPTLREKLSNPLMLRLGRPSLKSGSVALLIALPSSDSAELSALMGWDGVVEIQKGQILDTRTNVLTWTPVG